MKKTVGVRRTNKTVMAKQQTELLRDGKQTGLSGQGMPCPKEQLKLSLAKTNQKV